MKKMHGEYYWILRAMKNGQRLTKSLKHPFRKAIIKFGTI